MSFVVTDVLAINAAEPLYSAAQKRVIIPLP